MYCSINDVKIKNSHLLGSLPDARIAAEIEAAGEMVDGYLRAGGYPVPPSQGLGILKGITADITASALIADSIGRRGDDGEPTQAVELYKRAESKLRAIRKGTIKLQNAPKTQIRSSGFSDSKFSYTDSAGNTQQWNSSNPRTFSRNFQPSRPWRG